jgi:hypothetical protein
MNSRFVLLFVVALVGCDHEIECEPKFWYQDNDSDGFGNVDAAISSCTKPAGYVGNSDDCNDSNKHLPNAMDPNCDGIVEGDVVLGTETDVQVFGSGNVKSITGSLIIKVGGLGLITTLEPLIHLESIGGDLVIEGQIIKNLAGLENLNSVGQSVQLRFNDSLQSIDALKNLTSSNIGILIDQNGRVKDLSGLSFLTNPKVIYINEPEIQTLAGLQNVVSIEGNLVISSTKIKDVEQLANLTAIGGSLRIWSNASLNNLRGLRNVTEVGRKIDINYNDVLMTFEGLGKVKIINGDLIIANRNLLALDLAVEEIKGNLDVVGSESLRELNLFNLRGVDGSISLDGYQLKYAGFNQLTVVHGDLLITGTSIEPAQGFINLEKVEGDLYIGGGRVTADLSDLTNLQRVEGKLTIAGSTLSTLDGLASLEYIADDLVVHYNDHLTNLDGLSAVTFVGGDLIRVHTNPLLRNYCGIVSLFQNGGTQAHLFAAANGYNPTRQELVDGDCKR